MLTLHKLTSTNIYTGVVVQSARMLPNTTQVPPLAVKEGFERRFNPASKKCEYVPISELDPPAPTPVLAEVHASKVQEILTGATACATALKSRYSELEVYSWQMQTTQAEKVLAGEALAADALIVVLAAANAVSVDVFAQRVMANVTAAEQVTKAVVSQQQALELIVKSIMSDTALTDAAKAAELVAVEVVYDLGAGNG